MSMDERISTRIDSGLKKAAQEVFNQLGITEGEAIRMFYAQVSLHQGLPFHLSIPNKETIEAMKESKKDIDNLQTFKNFSDIRQKLDI